MPLDLADLADLPHPPELDGPWEEAPDDGVREIFPSDPGYIASIYLDADRSWTEIQRQQLMAHYTARFPGRRLDFCTVSRDSLRYRPLSLFPEMEQLFLQQGHVCDLEGRRFGDNGQQQILFVRHNRDALDMATFMLWEMLRLAGPELRLWDPRGDRGEAEHAAIVDTQTNLQLGHLLGRPSGRRGDRLIEIQLVEHAGMLLGCGQVTGEHRVHLAESVAPRGAWKAAQQADTCRALFGRSPEAIRAQVAWEVANAATLFDHRRDWPADHAERIARGVPPAAVTPGAVATWYSQVLTALRKAAWEAGARASTFVAGQDVRREAEVHRRPVGVASVPKLYRTATVRAHIDRAADLLAQHLSEVQGNWIAKDQVTAGFSTEQWLTAALHGASVHRDDPAQEPEADRALAAWIGDLKRFGHAHLDVFDAERLLGLEEDGFEGRDRFFRSQFSEAVWEALFDAAAEVDGGKDTLEVTYGWCADPAAPWGVERTADLLAIRGPLLSFPTCEAAWWADRAEVIRRLEEFLIPDSAPVSRRR
ncbi:hypothetical protein ABIE45_004697 [Methylobacterium sp. OAE515]|uniref:hypothetical protein n=1 Tax=Methylobacterium sp. OAE515 TaxID=2817895 RepID=UPI00178A9E71